MSDALFALFDHYAPHLEQMSSLSLIAAYLLYVGVIVGILALALDRVQRQRRAREQRAKVRPFPTRAYVEQGRPRW